MSTMSRRRIGAVEL